jgi:hypothetical protein
MNWKSSTLSAEGASLHHVNKGVEFNMRQPTDNESRCQGTEYIQQM